MEKVERLTTPQQRVYDKIQFFTALTGVSPTLEELRVMLEFSSLDSVSQCLDALERHHLITRRAYEQRGIELFDARADSNHDTVVLPVIASAGCDALNVYAQHTFGEHHTIEQSYIPPRTHLETLVLFRAVGESMNVAGIVHGDYVLVERTEEVRSGERVVAVLGDAAVIKRLRRVGATTVLEPASTDPHYERIVLKDDARIFGRVLDVITTADADGLVFERVAD